MNKETLNKIMSWTENSEQQCEEEEREERFP